MICDQGICLGWILYACLAASVLHMVEEYFYPGGFPAFMKSQSPRFAPWINTPFALIVNGLQLLLCLVAIALGWSRPLLGLSIAGLLLLNGLTHIGGCIRARRYAPGMVTGILLYLPLSVYTFAIFSSTGQLSPSTTAAALLLGAAYQAVPIVYLGVARALAA
jgi:hypothetical protein